MVNKEHITLSQGYTRNICKKKKNTLKLMIPQLFIHI